MSNEMSRQLRAKNIQTRLEASQGFAIHFLVSKAVPATENKKKEKHYYLRILKGEQNKELVR